MNGSLKVTGLCRAAALVSVLFLTACSGISSKPASLEVRATARWDALLSTNIAEAYEYLAPGYPSAYLLVMTLACASITARLA